MTPARRRFHRMALPLLLCLLVGPMVAGCTDGTERDPEPTPTDTTTPTATGDGDPQRLWTNPYDLPIRFDGAAAYDLALQQLYADPDAKSGPRYRIPGTEDHAAVGAELLAHLEDAMGEIGGTAAFQRFTGEDYYALDLQPVAPYLCAEDSAARDQVRDLGFMNIIARTDPDRIGFIIGAHWDTKRHATGSDEPILGADDGAASSAAVVELARAFAAAPADLAFTFILFDGEDGFERADCHPLAGSLYYAQNLSGSERETVEGMILLDMVGNASATYYREGNSKSFPGRAGTVSGTAIGDHVWATAAAMEVEAFVDRNTGRVIDDHVPFLYEGIPAIDIIRYDNGFAPYWHTTADDETAIQPEGIEQVGVVVEASLRRWSERDA